MIISAQELILSLLNAFLLRNDSQTTPAPTNRSRKIKRGLAAIVPLVVWLACASTPAYGGDRGGSTGGHQYSGGGAAVTIRLTDFGAIGDGVTDDGPALHSALEALANAGGGDLFVPDGHYAIATPVSVDFAGRASSVTIHGTPSSLPDGSPGDLGRGLNLTAEFLIKTGVGQNAITLRNLTTLLVQDLVFIGDPAVADDAKIVLSVSGVDDATLHRCEFYGLATFGAGGAIVDAAASGLQIADSAFLGCAANSGLYTSIVQLYDWKQISVTGTRFVDYGDRPDFYSKTPYQSPFSWISVGGAAPLTNLSPRRDVIIKDVFFDEGAYDALAVRPDLFAVPGAGAISLLYVSNLYVNVTNLGAPGLLIHSVDNVFIEDSHFGWSHNSSGAMDLSDVRNGLLDQIECVLSADTIIAANTVNELSVINSVYGTLASQALVTRVITTDPGDGPAQYVKQKYLDILGHAPDPAAFVYWSQQRARCNDDGQCSTDEALLNYLNGDPAVSFSISGRLVDTDGSPIAAATVSLGGVHSIDTTTDAEGRYRFAGLATGGEYTVTPAKTFYSFNAGVGSPAASSRSFITPAGDQSADFTGTLANYSIKGRVNNSTTGSALNGAAVTLTGGSAGFEPLSQNTTGPGDYAFEGLPAGYEYTVTPSKDYYTFAPAEQTVILAGNIVNLNYLGTPMTHSVGGLVTDGAHPLSGATVTLSGDASKNTASDENGNFVFHGVVAGGDYVVTVTEHNHTFVSQTVNDLLNDWEGNFTGAVIHYTITGGVIAGGSALSGATVTLSGSQSATVVTSSTGGYAFVVEAGGDYTLAAAKEGYSVTPTSVVLDDLDQNRYPSFNATPLPVLLTVTNTNRAIAFNSLSLLEEPFGLYTTPLDFGADQLTRLILFARLGIAGPATITAQAEDSQGHVYPLVVEFSEPLPSVPGITQINVKLDAQLTPNQDISASITVNGLTSANALIRIR